MMNGPDNAIYDVIKLSSSRNRARTGGLRSWTRERQGHVDEWWWRLRPTRTNAANKLAGMTGRPKHRAQETCRQ